MASAKNVWFMSEGQRNYYCNMYPFLDKKNVRVLSSVFNERTLDYIERLGDKIEKEDSSDSERADTIATGDEALADPEGTNAQGEQPADLRPTP